MESLHKILLSKFLHTLRLTLHTCLHTEKLLTEALEDESPPSSANTVAPCLDILIGESGYRLT